MNKLLIFILVILALPAKSQTVTSNNIYPYQQIFKGRFLVQDTVITLKRTVGSDSIYLQVKNGKGYLMGNVDSLLSNIPNNFGLSVTGGNEVDSVNRKLGTDSVFFYKEGNKYFAFRDSVGTGSTPAVDSLYKNTTQDSIVWKKNGIRYAIKDSIGPDSLPPNGVASGDLEGSYPNPEIHAIKGVPFTNDIATGLRHGSVMFYDSVNNEIKFLLGGSEGDATYLQRKPLSGAALEWSHIDSISTHNIVTKIERKPGTDSVFMWKNGLKSFAYRDSSGGGGGPGTVTSVGSGYGLTGGTITTSGTLATDTSVILAKARMQDSTFLKTVPIEYFQNTDPEVVGHEVPFFDAYKHAPGITLTTHPNFVYDKQDGFSVGGATELDAYGKMLDLHLQEAEGLAIIGDVEDQVNGTKIYVDDPAKLIYLVADSLVVPSLSTGNGFVKANSIGTLTKVALIDSASTSGVVTKFERKVGTDSVFTWRNGTKSFAYRDSIGSGTVTSVAAGFGVTGSTITTSGTLALDTTGATSALDYMHNQNAHPWECVFYDNYRHNVGGGWPTLTTAPQYLYDKEGGFYVGGAPAFGVHPNMFQMDFRNGQIQLGNNGPGINDTTPIIAGSVGIDNQTQFIIDICQNNIYWWADSIVWKNFLGGGNRIMTSNNYGRIIPSTTIDSTYLTGVVTKIERKPGTDSVFTWRSGTKSFAYRDSIGSGSGGGIDSIRPNSSSDSLYSYSSGSGTLVFKNTNRKIMFRCTQSSTNPPSCQIVYNDFKKSIYIADSIYVGGGLYLIELSESFVDNTKWVVDYPSGTFYRGDPTTADMKLFKVSPWTNTRFFLGTHANDFGAVDDQIDSDYPLEFTINFYMK